MPRWFNRWSNFDSARSLGEWVFWGVCLAFNTTSAAVIAAAAAYTQWYWDAYGLIGVAFAFLVAVVILPLSAFLAASAAFAAATARSRWNGSARSNLENNVAERSDDIDISCHLEEMDERIAQLRTTFDEKITDISVRLGGHTYGDKKDNFDRLRDSIAYESDARTRDIAGVQKSIDGIRSGIVRAESDIRALHEKISSVFHAQRTLQIFESTDRDIINIAEKMSNPVFGDDNYKNWESWVSDYSAFGSMLRVMCGVVAPYCQIEAEVFSTPIDKYKSRNWTSDFAGMDDDQRHDYKTFRIIYANYRKQRTEILSKITSAAHNIP